MVEDKVKVLLLFYQTWNYVLVSLVFVTFLLNCCSEIFLVLQIVEIDTFRGLVYNVITSPIDKLK